MTGWSVRVRRSLPLILLAAMTLVVVGVAGCAGLRAARETPPAAAVGSGVCSAEKYAALVGRPASQIDPATLPPAHRTICFGCMATMDFSPDRLTIQLGPDGKVASIRCS